MSENPFDLESGMVRFGDGPPVPVSAFATDSALPRRAGPPMAGSLEVRGTITGEFTGDGANVLKELLGLDDPKHDMRVECPVGADRRCPVCKEPASALVLEDVTVFSGSRAPNVGDGTGHWLMGLDPDAYCCEPCGHRFGRDGKEIAP
jgi:hypothetical protein